MEKSTSVVGERYYNMVVSRGKTVEKSEGVWYNMG